MLNKNSYLSIGIVVLIVLSALWIRDGQAKALATSDKTAQELLHYKELQAKDAEVVKTKLDAITALFTQATQDRFSGKEARAFAHGLQQLNPEIKVPDIP